MTAKKIFDNDYANQWCPGCGNFGILNAMKTALADQDLSPEEILIISGIGQAAKTPHFLKCNMLHSLHGRALPIALGAKMANHDLKILVNTGDGDCYGEGGNHFIHAVRRNPDLTVLVHNNQVYGLTKGQASPTSMDGMETPLQPQGVISSPLNGPALALTMGAGFVARGFSGEPDHLAELISAAMEYKGFSVIDILQPCVSFNKLNTAAWYKERIKKENNPDPRDFDRAMKLAMTFGDTIPLGIYLNQPKPEFTSRIQTLQQGPLALRPYDPSPVQKLLADQQAV
ncbi:2-oxoacid:ferredoxin oxidoreductase subunit beta [Desulfospira joergensenii]|uniref:2-oxoacid:ferredoxin oxidoreductase subunit beta n=1 Tax=Desulfospira joergensenii TaxID=53329 RepID=UPI0003B4E1A2|nr:2-oxoacid:ferredoxin oxidoreductase subunit beta [Desulfospira joergensenii]